MPKRVFKLVEFDGGENRTKDPRDLELNECAQAKGVDFDRLGRIRVSGSGVEVIGLFSSTEGVNGTLHTINGVNTNVTNFIINSGYGIYNFLHDYNMDTYVAGDSPLEVESEFIAIAYRFTNNNLYIGI